MSLPRLVLCLTLLVSCLGSAQTSEEWTPYTPPPAETATPPPLVPAPTPPPPAATPQAPAEEDEPEGEVIPRELATERANPGQTALRLVVLPWSGGIVGMMGLIIGAIPTAIIALPFCMGADEFEDSPRCMITVTTGLAVSYSVGVTVGVSVIGKTMGGRGDGIMTFLGALAGAALGSGIGIATDSTGGLVLGLALCPLLGAIVTYELSHTLPTEPVGPELRARSGFQVVPVVSATPRGGILGGLAGRF